MYNSDDNIAPALLDGICKDDCVGPLNDYFECLLGYQGYADYLCVRQNNEYCLVIRLDVYNTCGDDCDKACNDTCCLCLSGYVDDFSCCLDQYRSHMYSFVNVTELEEDVCGNRYDTCSGSAIAVPTVLTALLRWLPLSCEEL